jgi:hypothetical protein
LFFHSFFLFTLLSLFSKIFRTDAVKIITSPLNTFGNCPRSLSYVQH